jgi:hypothetical protein
VSGDVGITGVGFTPKIILFAGNAAGIAPQFFGAGKVGANFAMPYGGISTSYALKCETVDAGKYQTAIVKSLDVDGFTLTWSKTSTPTGTATIGYVALG